MQITIIGTGRMARGISERLLRGGHDIELHARNIDTAKKLAEHLGNNISNSSKVTIGEYGGMTQHLVLMAVPYHETTNVGKDYDGFAGRIVIDISNPINFSTLQLVTPPGISGAEEIARHMPDAKVVKAFNTVFDPVLSDSEGSEAALDIFVAGDDQDAKENVKELISSSGMRPIDAGPLSSARHLEGIELIHISAQKQLGTNRMSAIKFLS